MDFRVFLTCVRSKRLCLKMASRPSCLGVLVLVLILNWPHVAALVHHCVISVCARIFSFFTFSLSSLKRIVFVYIIFRSSPPRPFIFFMRPYVTG